MYSYIFFNSCRMAEKASDECETTGNSLRLDEDEKRGILV